MKKWSIRKSKGERAREHEIEIESEYTRCVVCWSLFVKHSMGCMVLNLTIYIMRSRFIVKFSTKTTKKLLKLSHAYRKCVVFRFKMRIAFKLYFGKFSTHNKILWPAANIWRLYTKWRHTHTHIKITMKRDFFVVYGNVC